MRSSMPVAVCKQSRGVVFPHNTSGLSLSTLAPRAVWELVNVFLRKHCSEAIATDSAFDQGFIAAGRLVGRNDRLNSLCKWVDGSCTTGTSMFIHALYIRPRILLLHAVATSPDAIDMWA